MKKLYTMIFTAVAAMVFATTANAQKPFLSKAPAGDQESPFVAGKTIPMSEIESIFVEAPEKGKKHEWSDWKYYSEGTYTYVKTGCQKVEGLTGPITIYTREDPTGEAVTDTAYNCKFNYGFEGFWDNIFASKGFVGPKLIIGRDDKDSLHVDYQDSGLKVKLTSGDSVSVMVSDGRDYIKPQYQYKYTGYEDQELGTFNLFLVYWTSAGGRFGAGWKSSSSEGAWSQWLEDQTGEFTYVFLGDDEAEDPADNMQELDDLKCRVSNKSSKYIQITTETWGQGFATRAGVEAMFQINTTDNTIYVPEFNTGYTLEKEDDNGDVYDIEVLAADAKTAGFSKIPWEEFPSTWDPETKTLNLSLVYYAHYPSGFMKNGTDYSTYVMYWYPKAETFVYTGEIPEPDPIIPTGLKGDANGDGVVDVADITAIAGYILGEIPTGFNSDNADANSDSVIDVADITATASIILGN